MNGSEITAEIPMKIGSSLMSKRASRIASRSALPATNDATTISALIVASRAAPRCSSWFAMAARPRLPGGGLARALCGDESIVQPAGPYREHEPAHCQHHVQRGKRANAEPQDLREQK